MQPIVNWVFYKNVTAVQDTTPYANYKNDAMFIEISGDASSFEVVFEGKVDLANDNWTPIAGINMSDFTTTTSAITSGVWVLPIEGLQQVRARLVSVSGGAISILGRVINSVA